MSHPRFPFGMDPELRRTIADEVDVTLAGYPSKRSLEAAITAYAEQLEDFLPSDVRGGFREARKHAHEYAPSPSQVYAFVASVCRRRRESEQSTPDGVDHGYGRPLASEEIPNWREMLRGILPEAPKS